MTYLFYGADTYRINEKLKALSERFLAGDESGMNLEKLDGATLTYAKFDQAISTMPFLGDKRLVIIKNLLLHNKDNDLKLKIAERLKKTSDDMVVFFVEEGEPDKRGKLFKELNKPKKSHKFEPLEGRKLSDWIKEKVIESGANIGSREADFLASSVGPDLVRLENEIKKLSNFCLSQERDRVEEADIELQVRANFEPNIFDFIESLSKKDAKKAYSLKTQFIDLGESENYLLSMIIYQYRNMIKIAELKDAGKSMPEIAKEAKVHPFVVRKTFSILNNYTLKDLFKIYKLLYKTDLGIKSGELEPPVALDRVLARLSV